MGERRLVGLAVGALVLASRSLGAQGLEYVKAYYTKYEYQVPMRDGKKLFTVVDDGYDECVSDPARPMPFIEDVNIDMTREYMTDDQRFASRRPDVLTFEGDVLDEDVTVAGPVQASLFVSTSGTDSDFVVKLIDVYPNDAPDPNEKEKEPPDPRGGPTYTRMGGYQQLVRGEPMRGKSGMASTRPGLSSPTSPPPSPSSCPTSSTPSSAATG